MLERATRLVPSKLRYHFDNYMAWSGTARFLLLVGLGAIALFIGVATLWIFAPESAQAKDGWEAVWWSWGRVMDPGTGTADEGTGLRAASIITTITGLCVFVLLVGFVATAVQENLERLRQTGAAVAESGHTLLLGYGEKTLKLVEELSIANSSRKDACVVILSSRPKSDVIHDVLDRFGANRVGTTRIVVREGSCTSVRDLLEVAIAQARSVIVMPDGVGRDDADIQVIKTLLVLLRGLPFRLRARVVTEVENAQRIDVINSIDPEAAVAVVAREFLSRLMIQSIRQPGLARVYAELLSFAGEEFYLRPMPQALVGRTFRDAWSGLAAVVAVGVQPGGRGAVAISPPDDHPLGADDRLLLLATDADVPLVVRPQTVDASPPPETATTPQLQAQRLLVLGYRPDLPAMIREIDLSFPAGSEVTVVSSVDAAEVRSRVMGRLPALRNVKLQFVQGDTTLRETLETVAARPFDGQVLVGDTNTGTDPAAIDARTLMTLLLIRGLERSGGFSTTRLVSEVRDPRTKELASITQIGDFVVSDELVSQLIAQLSESADLAGVWGELTTSDGCELYLKPIQRYVTTGEASFFDVMTRARARGEVALGWTKPEGGFELNPSDKQSKRRLGEKTEVVVVARE